MAPNTTSREAALQRKEGQGKSESNESLENENRNGKIIGPADKDGDYVQEEDTTTDDEAEDEEDDHGVPIDRGWAWVIMMCYFSMNIIAVGFGKSFGVIFVEFLKEFQTPVYMTSLIPGCQAAVYCISVLLTLNVLVEVISIRKVLVMGSVTMTLGILLTSVAMNVGFLIFSVSFIQGLGSAMTFAPHMVLMGRYFKDRRTIATAFAYSGVSLGGVLIPLLIRFLIDEFGFRGCLLLYSGIISNMIVFAALCRDTNSYRPKKKRPSELESEASLTVLEVEELSAEEAERARLQVRRRLVLGGGSRRLHTVSSSSTRSLSVMIDSISKASVVRYASHPELLTGSIQDLGPRGFGSNSKFPPPPEDQKPGSKLGKLCGCQGKQLFDFSFFKNPMFLVLAAINFSSVLAGGTTTAFVPALAREKGLSQVQAALLLTTAGALDFFGRLLAGLIGDRGWVRPPRLVAIYFLVVGTLDQFTAYYNSFGLMMMFMALYGLLHGSYFTLLPDIINDYMGADNFPKVFAFSQVFHGITNAAAFPVLGALKDITGTYTASFRMIGGSLYVSSALLLSEPLLRRLIRRREERKSQTTEVDPEPTAHA